MKRILVCGGRNYNNADLVNRVLTAFHLKDGIDMIIQGGALGADALARSWAYINDIQCASYEAKWVTMDKRAGPVRNQQMLDDGKPDFVIAFPGGSGTADMIRRAKAARVPVVEITES